MSNRILIVFYTHSGNTRHVANQIEEQTGGKLLEIGVVDDYPQEYSAVVQRAKKEIQKQFRPEICPISADPADYDVVFLGSPNWWSTIAPPVATFLEQNDFSNKKIIPFITHGGGGVNRTVEDIKKLCANARVLAPLVVCGDGDAGLQKKIADWLNQINYLN